MRICKLDRANQVYGAGGPSMDFGWTPAPAPVQPAVNSLYSGGGTGSHTSVNGSSSGNASLGSFFGSFFGTDSGVTNGKRDDGNPVGYGCGNVQTDKYVPDHLLGHDLTPACRNHDIGYSTCGVAKDVADAKLGSDVSAAMGGGLLGGIVGSIYHAGAATFGQSSYDQAQTDAGCRNTGGGGGQSDHSGESGAGRTDARGGYGSYGGGSN